MRWSFVLFGGVLSTILAFLSWGTVLFFVNPENATPLEWLLFSTTLFLLLGGVCSLAVLLMRRMILGSERALLRVGTSVRQGILGAIFCMGVLFLLRAEWLVWWDALFLFGFLFLIELFFLRKFRIKKAE